MLMVDGRAGNGEIRRMVDAAWSANAASAYPDDPLVRGFAEFGLASSSSLATDDNLRSLEAWRDNLRIPGNSAFLDGTLLLTVESLLGPNGPEVLTPVTLWELTAFIDALVCFDRLYCIANPAIDVADFNRRLGAEVLLAVPDPRNGMLRRLAAEAAADGLANMSALRMEAGSNDVFGQEVQAVVDGWRAVLGADFPNDGPFDMEGLDIRLAGMAAPATEPDFRAAPAAARFPLGARAGTPLYGRRHADERHLARSSAALVDGSVSVGSNYIGLNPPLRVLVDATRVPPTAAASATRPSLTARRQLAATATYRTYVNQGIANALGLPYLPGTLRMPFRRLFVQRAAQVQDELVTVALADRIFAQQQPSAPLILPFFTAAVLRGATTRAEVWDQMAHTREQSASFRHKRAELDALLERSEVSPKALRLQAAIRDEGLRTADLVGVTQQSASVALGVIAQTGIVPLAGALKVGVDAVQGAGRDGDWTRIWRRLFRRHEYFLAQTDSQAIALTNALPQIQQLWQMPKIGGYLDRFASATQQMGHVLRD
jgi:hypothetical protein